MQVNVQVGLSTDGDYSLRNHLDLEMPFDGFEGYYNSLLFTDDNPKQHKFEDSGDMQFNCRWRAINWLRKILCELHVSYTHYYLIEDLYNLFNEAIEAIGRVEDFHKEISGNYEGTYIQVNFFEKGK